MLIIGIIFIIKRGVEAPQFYRFKGGIIMNYSIIKDQDELKRFIDWLPDLLPNEVFYGWLMSRRKYCDEAKRIKSDAAQLKRFVSSKERLYDTIAKLEIPLGLYKINGVEVPVESMALYINPNPRDCRKASKSLIHRLVEMEYNHEQFDYLQRICLTEIHKASGAKVFTNIDIDVNVKANDSIYSSICNAINQDAVTIVETRGGYHILVEHSKISEQYQRTWYKALTSLPGFDTSHGELPVPGCIQGDFIPRFLNINGSFLHRLSLPNLRFS